MEEPRREVDARDFPRDRGARSGAAAPKSASTLHPRNQFRVPLNGTALVSGDYLMETAADLLGREKLSYWQTQAAATCQSTPEDKQAVQDGELCGDPNFGPAVAQLLYAVRTKTATLHPALTSLRLPSGPRLCGLAQQKEKRALLGMPMLQQRPMAKRFPAAMADTTQRTILGWARRGPGAWSNDAFCHGWEEVLWDESDGGFGHGSGDGRGHSLSDGPEHGSDACLGMGRTLVFVMARAALLGMDRGMFLGMGRAMVLGMGRRRFLGLGGSGFRTVSARPSPARSQALSWMRRGRDCEAAARASNRLRHVPIAAPPAAASSAPSRRRRPGEEGGPGLSIPMHPARLQSPGDSTLVIGRQIHHGLALEALRDLAPDRSPIRAILREGVAGQIPVGQLGPGQVTNAAVHRRWVTA